MKRRNFLKLLGVSPLMPSVLAGKEKRTFQKALTGVVRQKLSKFRDGTYYDYYSFEDKTRVVYKVDGDVHIVVDMQQFDEHPFVLFEKQNVANPNEISYIIRKL